MEDIMNEILKQKLQDMDEPGVVIELTSEEADELGFTIETASGLEDAMAARYDEV